MSLAIIIPFKGVKKAKSRLMKHLPENLRKEIVISMLKRTLIIANKVTNNVYLLTTDEDLPKEIRNLKFTFLKDPYGELNKALESTLQNIATKGYSKALILPIDLPLLSEEDLRIIMKMADDNRNVVIIAPSLNNGTNCLLLAPPNILKPVYGHNSFKKHYNQALRKGVTVKIYISQRVYYDIDEIDDLLKLSKYLVRDSYWRDLVIKILDYVKRS